MNELITDLWSLLLPEEWQAEQDDETIFIVDLDEVSIIEVTPLFPEKGEDVKSLLAELKTPSMKAVQLAEVPALYHSFEEDDMYWREWICDAGKFVLTISHGTDSENKGMDDSSVDEILSTLIINTGE